MNEVCRFFIGFENGIIEKKYFCLKEKNHIGPHETKNGIQVEFILD